MSRPSRLRSRTSLLLGSLGLAIVLSGCASTSQSGGSAVSNARVTPPPEISLTPGVATGTPVAAAPATPRVMAAVDLERAFRALTEQFVDVVDHRILLKAASQALKDSLATLQLLPLFTLPLDVQPTPTKNPQRDWQAFAAGYDAVVAKQPTWATSVRPDWLVIRAMAESLQDGHTYYRTADEVRRSQETTYGGIGVGLAASQAGDGPLVSEVFPNSPALQAGMRRGDRILAVDGQPLLGRPLSDVVSLIRGETGTEVGLQVRRLNAPGPVNVRVRRAQVQVDPVVAQPSQDGTLAYLRIRNFGSADVLNRTRSALQNGSQRGIKGWVLDLRGNPGGQMTAVQGVAGAFLDAKLLGYEVDRNANRQEILATGPALVQNVPVVVLIDKDTASGAEILASALRDNLQAQIVGVTSAGNVEVAQPVPLADGSVLQVTVQRYETGTGARMDRTGIQPDVEVQQKDSDLEAGGDTQLLRAVEILTGQIRQG